MTAVLAILGGLVGGALGWVVAAFAALVIGSAMGVSNFEGQRAMTAIFFFGPIGGLAGIIAGVALVLRLRRRRA